jgi:hypothetical protein
MSSETMCGDRRPYRLDHSERPRPRQEAVDTCEHTSAGEREDEADVPPFEGVHDHHEGEGCYAEGGEQRPQFVRALGREGCGSRPSECGDEHCEHRQISVKLDAGESASAKGAKSVLVLQPAETPLYGSAPSVGVAVPLALARGQRVEAGSRAPDGGRLALAGRAAALRTSVLEFGLGERPPIRPQPRPHLVLLKEEQVHLECLVRPLRGGLRRGELPLHRGRNVR